MVFTISGGVRVKNQQHDKKAVAEKAEDLTR